MLILILSFYFLHAYSLNQLSFSGGGSFGAVEIGMLKRVLEVDRKKYDLYTGISVGALNAGFLSYYSDVNVGVKHIEKIYSSLKNKMVYDILPNTGISLLNSKPLQNTLSSFIHSMPNESMMNTLVGTTNLYSGKLDIYNFKEQNNNDKILLLMASCALPGIFPPVKFNDCLYADGGILSNELIEVLHDGRYLNITFITPHDDFIYDDSPVVSLRDVLCRTILALKNNFNQPMACMNQNCKYPIGEINKYYISSEILKNYNILNFEKGEELINIGYKNVLHKKYFIC
jgi:NTE family protein